MAVLRELWTTPLVTFEGQDHIIPDAGLNPMPVQRPIPIWFGGSADAALRRIARISDGWIADSLPYEKLRTAVEQLRGYLREAGRDPDTFGLDVRFNIWQPPEGSWKQEVERAVALGATHVCINTMDAGFTRLDEHLEAVKRFKGAVG